MDDIIRQEPWMLIPVLAMAGGFACVICCMVTGTIRRVRRTREFEQSRREIAAYVAEGSMAPDEGERLLAQKA